MKNSKIIISLVVLILILAAGVAFFALNNSKERQQTSNTTTQVANELGLTIFLKEKANEEEVMSLQKELENTAGIASTKFISKEEAYEIYKEQNKDEPLLLQNVTADFLPASIEVYFSDTAKVEAVYDLVKGKDFIQIAIKHQQPILFYKTLRKADEKNFLKGYLKS